jgi:hypothetical protein
VRFPRGASPSPRRGRPARCRTRARAPRSPRAPLRPSHRGTEAAHRAVARRAAATRGRPRVAPARTADGGPPRRRADPRSRPPRWRASTPGAAPRPRSGRRSGPRRERSGSPCSA